MGPDIELSPWQDFLAPHFFLEANTSVATTSSDASPFRQVIWELSVPSITAAELGVSPARRPLSRPSHIDPPRHLNPVGIPESAKGSVIAPSHQTVSSARSVNAHLHSLRRRKSDCVLREQREAVLGPSRLLLSGLLNLFQGPFCSLMVPGCLQASMMPLRKLEKGALSGQM